MNREAPDADAPLSTLRVVREMAHVYRERWAFLLGAGLVVFMPLGLIESVNDPAGEIDADDLDAVTAAELGALGLAQSVSALVATVLYAGIIAAAVAARRGGAEPSLSRLARTLPYRRLIVADLLLVLVVAAGLLLLLVPGLILLTWFALVAPAIKLEGRGVIDAFRRSRALVRPYFWRVAMLVVPTFFVEELIGSAVESGSVAIFGESFLGEWAGGLLGNLVAAPIFALAVVVLFYELRERSQGRGEAKGADEETALRG